MAEGKPLKIGLLQRYATDALMAEGGHPYDRAKPTGKKVAVLGAGLAGLSCAHPAETYDQPQGGCESGGGQCERTIRLQSCEGKD